MRISKLLITLTILFFNMTVHAGVGDVVETITFVKEDGRHFVEYSSRRTDSSRYYLAYDKAKTLEELEKSYLYVFPNSYRYDTSSDLYINKLKFPQGDFGIMSSGDLGEVVTVDEDGVYTYHSWSGKKTPNGHYGISNFTKNFKQAAMAWVFPDNLEVIHYHSNRPGEWVQRGNTIAYFGENVNDLVFTLQYRPRASSYYDALKEAMEGEDVEMELLDSGVKIILAETILFPTGSSVISGSGKRLLAKLAPVFREKGLRAVVEGHTDNVPIIGMLAKVFPTNWELSSGRALAVVHYLHSIGMPQKDMEARAFSYMRPRATNSTPEGRRLNRRIEILLVENTETENVEIIETGSGSAEYPDKRSW